MAAWPHGGTRRDSPHEAATKREGGRGEVGSDRKLPIPNYFPANLAPRGLGGIGPGMAPGRYTPMFHPGDRFYGYFVGLRQIGLLVNWVCGAVKIGPATCVYFSKP